MLRRLVPALLAAAAAVVSAEPYLPGDLQAEADRLALADDREWLTLLHVEPTWYGLRRSMVDDPAFFLSPRGVHDPAAELAATIEAVLKPVEADARHAVQRFPARTAYLVRRLGLDPARLPMPRSEEFEEAYRGLGPRSAAIAFPTAYMNTPASMFGHTLLVIRSRVRTGMASQAINYAALTGEDGGVAFAVKGVLGGYPGHFSLMPYWQKLNEYSDLDQRDVWEYELALSPEDIRRMLLHVWEMRGIRSDYWFFDENCAYYLLYLIDAARPDLRLHDAAPPWVIPLDTVRILCEAGLVDEVEWRPSLATKVKARAARMPAERAARARRIALGEEPPTAAVDGDPAAAADELDLAIDYLQALRNRRKVEQAAFQPRFVGILQARARLGVPAREAISAPTDVAPDQGHRSLRLGFGGGISGDKTFISAEWRPAYHDLLDPAPGYVEGAQIDFMGIEGRWYEGDARPTLERWEAIGLRSFSPRDVFFTPPSWKVDTGITRELVGGGGHSEHHAFLDFGVGACWSLPWSGLWYATVDADLRIVDTDPSLALGLGPEIGAVVRAGPLSLNPVARWSSFVGELPADNWSIGVSGSYALHRDLAFAFDLAREATWDWLSTTAALRVNAYF
ncbi:MAG: DUF4105 domain-containing protein [Planctomycetes bacterium]|nr:DUF4105 domain-containing protein [Planctomycetota bacterium]